MILTILHLIKTIFNRVKIKKLMHSFFNKYFMEQSSIIKVFCYGSNMSSKRITAAKRCPSATYFCIAKIDGYRLFFNKISTDKSSKANIVSTQNASDIVWGVIFQIPLSKKKFLDAAEGLGFGYEEYSISVVDQEGHFILCQCYIATNANSMNDSLQPYDWYKEHCVIGAEEYNLPHSYVDSIKLFPAKIDSCVKRAENERSIYSV